MHMRIPTNNWLKSNTRTVSTPGVILPTTTATDHFVITIPDTIISTVGGYVATLHTTFNINYGWNTAPQKSSVARVQKLQKLQLASKQNNIRLPVYHHHKPRFGPTHLAGCYCCVPLNNIVFLTATDDADVDVDSVLVIVIVVAIPADAVLVLVE